MPFCRFYKAVVAEWGLRSGITKYLSHSRFPSFVYSAAGDFIVGVGEQFGTEMLVGPRF